MTTLAYVRKAEIGTLTEIREAQKADPTIMETLKRWAAEEMTLKGIEITPDANPKVN